MAEGGSGCGFARRAAVVGAVMEGSVMNHGLLLVGTAGGGLGAAANGGSDLIVRGAFESDGRVEVLGRVLTLEGVGGDLGGTVKLVGWDGADGARWAGGWFGGEREREG